MQIPMAETPRHSDTVADSEMSYGQFLFILMNIVQKIVFTFRVVLVHSNKINCHQAIDIFPRGNAQR